MFCATTTSSTPGLFVETLRVREQSRFGYLSTHCRNPQSRTWVISTKNLVSAIRQRPDLSPDDAAPLSSCSSTCSMGTNAYPGPSGGHRPILASMGAYALHGQAGTMERIHLNGQSVEKMPLNAMPPCLSAIRMATQASRNDTGWL